jgi:hypothetical protein
MNKLAYTILGLALFFVSISMNGQNVSSKKLEGGKHDAYIDSLKNTPYPWRFPILGQKVRKLGFDIPYPNGLMVNYVIGSQDITLNNLAVGLHPDDITNVDNIARFQPLVATVNVLNLRYDVWILPFLDAYILGGYVNSTSDIEIVLPITAGFTSHSKGPMVGWGIAAAAGLGPLFVTTDYSMAWTFMPQLDKPSVAKVFDIRLGHTFDFTKKPSSNISVLVGAQYLKLNSYSAGNLDASEKLGMTPEKREKALGELDSWYSGLPQPEQDLFGGFYDTMDSWLSKEDDTFIYYTFNKKLYYPWSMTFGVNYQLNHRHSFMALYTFLGSRQQLMVSYNYRFGFKGKNMLQGLEF